MIVPVDGMVITKDTVLQPGVYVLPHGIVIGADDVSLDGNGALLLGRKRLGQGVSVEGYNGITIKNLHLREYKRGIGARGCRKLSVLNCVITSTAELPPNSVFLDIWHPPEEAYGGGILLWDVQDSLVMNNDLQHQMVGLHSYFCQNLTVRDNVANYCSGFGYHLYETCDSLYQDNYADFCCRFEPRDGRRGHMGADSAGFLIVHSSCRNVFRRNSARLGGDGFFLSGLTADFVPAGCDDNLFEENDGSHSPNIAFEATFSQGNVFKKNVAKYSNYGFWLGFSSRVTLEENTVTQNHQAGIACENGYGMTVRKNLLEANGHGILLWSRPVIDLTPTGLHNATSSDWLIEENTLNRNGKAIRIAADQDHGVRPFETPSEGSAPTPRPRNHAIRANRIEGNRVGIELVDVEETELEKNKMNNNLEADVVENGRHRKPQSGEGDGR